MALRKIAKISRIPLVLGLAFGLMAHSVPATAAILDFEGLDAVCDASNPASSGIVNPYGGLNWSSVSGTSFGSVAVGLACDANYAGASYNNTYGSPSGSYAAFNGDGHGTLLITPVSGTFIFNGAQFTTFADADAFGSFSAFSVALLGYTAGNVLSFTGGFDLLSTGYVFQNPGPWAGLTRLEILAGNGAFGDTDTAFGGDGLYFLMDNADLTADSSAIPEPGTALLLVTGLAVVASRLRRRRS